MSPERKNKKNAEEERVFPEILDRVSQACRKVAQKENRWDEEKEALEQLDNLLSFFAFTLIPESALDETKRLDEDKFVRMPTGTILQCYTQEQVDFVINNFSGEEVLSDQIKARFTSQPIRSGWMAESKIIPEKSKII